MEQAFTTFIQGQATTERTLTRASQNHHFRSTPATDRVRPQGMNRGEQSPHRSAGIPVCVGRDRARPILCQGN